MVSSPKGVAAAGSPEHCPLKASSAFTSSRLPWGVGAGSASCRPPVHVWHEPASVLCSTPSPFIVHSVVHKFESSFLFLKSRRQSGGGGDWEIPAQWGSFFLENLLSSFKPIAVSQDSHPVFLSPSTSEVAVSGQTWLPELKRLYVLPKDDGSVIP